MREEALEGRFDDTKEDIIDDCKDLKEDYQEISARIRRGLKRLSNATSVLRSICTS